MRESAFDTWVSNWPN